MTYTDVNGVIFDSVFGELLGTFNVESIVIFLAYAATVVIGMVFAWWAIRKVVSIVMSAFRKGKLKM